jgi:multicomponent Na+:H+ antiporter subunit B
MTEFFELPFKLSFAVDEILLVISALVMVITCIRLVLSKSLIESVIVMSVFSLFIGICYLFMDAPDVAMTETALGACLSTCVLLNIIKIVGDDIGKPKRIKVIMSAILCITFIACLSWASLDLPEFGAENSPLQQHLTGYYLENTKNDIAIPSMVAAILASYRGYDTLGETTVILIAGLAVLVIISRRKKTHA